MLTYTFPTNVALDIVTQEYVIDTSKHVGDSILPYTDFNSYEVRWDERDAERGMTAPHALGTDPTIDKRPGSKTRSYTGIPFKQSDVLDERDLLLPRTLGTLGSVRNINAEVARIMKARIDKTQLRVEWLRWQTLQGGFAIDENGVVVTETFPIQTYDATNWSDHANSTPLKDVQTAALKFEATGASPQGAVIYINQRTLNDVLENKNEADLWGFRNLNFLALTFSLDEVNKIFTARGLPTFALYNEGYIDDDGDFQTFIANAKAIIVGKRPAGQVPGNFARTISPHRIVNGMPAPGFFEIIEVNGGPNPGSASVDLALLANSSNPNIKMTGGVYGGTLLWYPRSIIRMDVGA